MPARKETPLSKPVALTVEQLDDFCRLVAWKATRCNEPKKKKKLDSLFQKAHKLLGRPDDEQQTSKIEDARQEQMLSQQAVQIADFAARALIAAEQLRIETKPLEPFWLAPAQRDVLLLVPTLSKTVRNKLVKDSTDFTAAEVSGMVLAVAEDLPEGDARKQVLQLMVAKHLMDRLQEGIMAKEEPPARKKSKRKPKATRDVLYQFKFTLLESSLRSGDEFRSQTARSTNTSRPQWAGPTPISINSRSRAGAMVFPNCSKTALRTSTAKAPQRRC